MGHLRTASLLRFRSLGSGDVLRRCIQGQGTKTGDLLAHLHSFGLFGRTEMSAQLFCGYLKDLLLPVGEDKSDTDGNCFSGPKI